MCACLALVLTAAACSSPAGDPTGSDELARFRQETARRLQEIESELGSLGSEQRRSRLIEMARSEGAVVDFYGVTNVDDLTGMFDAFEEETGVTVNYFRAGAVDILQRLTEEARVGFRGVDFINLSGPYMTILDEDGLLAAVNTPVAEDITPQGVHDTWLWAFVDVFAAAWNTDQISPAEVPRTWEDVFTDYPGRLAMEDSDFHWFATLVKDHFVAEEGMGEEEALELFRTAARGATIVDGHTLMTELLAAGEFAVAASPFTHRVDQFQREGAPLEWEPAVVPLVANGDAVAIHAAARHPASALLFLEYYLNEGQAMGAELDRQPASTAVPGGGLPAQHPTLTIDADVVVDELDKWLDLYDGIVRLSGGELVTG